MFFTFDYHLSNQIAKCIPIREHSSTHESFDFPLDTIVYQFMKSSEIEDVYGGIDGLQLLFHDYSASKTVPFLLQELLDDQWIRVEFGEWHPTLSHFREEWLPKIQEEKLRETLAFLQFLHEKEMSFHKAAVIQEPEKILGAFRPLFPNTPKIEWFTENNILEEHKNAYAFRSGYWKYSRAMNAAAAMLWVSDIDHDNVNDKNYWLSLVCACSATSGVLKHLTGKHRADLLQWIVETLEQEAWLGDVDRERKFITRLAMSSHINVLAEKKYNQIDSADLYPEDLIERLHFSERSHYDIYLSLYYRDKIHFLASALFKEFTEIPSGYQKRAADILFQLHSTGYFSRPDVTNITRAEAVANFTRYEKTQFLSTCLLLSYVSADKAIYNYSMSVFGALFDSILSGSIWQHSQCRTDPEQVSLIIQYLISFCNFFEKEQTHENEQPKERSELCFSILTLFIAKLKTDYQRTKDILRKAICDLGDALEHANKFKKARILACLITIAQQIYWADVSEEKDEIYELILRYLNRFYLSVWQENTNNADVYLSAVYWLLPVWYDVYLRANIEEREYYRVPLKLSELRKAVENNDYSVRHTAVNKATLQTGILCGIAVTAKQNQSNDPDTTIEVQNALYDCLAHYQADNLFDVFHINNLDRSGIKVVFGRIGAYINPKHNAWARFEKSLSDAPIERLLLWLDVTHSNAAENHIRELLDTALTLGRLPTDEVVRTEMLIGLIQEYHIEKLYAWCEDELHQLLEYLEKYKDNPIIENRIRLAYNQLYFIYYSQGKYDIIESGDNLFFKGVLSLNNNEFWHACMIFEQLSKSQPSAPVYLNLLYGYVLLLKETAEHDHSKFERYWSKSGKVIELADTLCANWSEEQRAYYASHLVSRHELMHGKDTEYIRKIEVRFQVRIDSLPPQEAQTEASDDEITKNILTVDVNTDEKHGLSSALSRFHGLSFPNKCHTYLQQKGISGADVGEAYEIMLLKFVLETQQHIHEYSTQLYQKNAQLAEYEDRYTELFREMFNHAYGEFWNIVCGDQEKGGPTGAPTNRGGGISEKDLTFRVAGYTATIGEAIFLERFTKKERANTTKHIGKLIASSNGYSPLFYIIYYHGRDPNQFWVNYQQYVCGADFKSDGCLFGRASATVPFDETPLYQKGIFLHISGPRVLCTNFSYADGRSARLYHIFSDIRNEPAVVLARASRR